MTNQFVKSIDLKRDLIGSFDKYPFCLPAIKNFDSLELHPKVTYIIGENGTHSPILMAYPDSYIYEIGDGIKRVSYEETEHYQIMKAFINNKEKMLRELLLP